MPSKNPVKRSGAENTRVVQTQSVVASGTGPKASPAIDQDAIEPLATSLRADDLWNYPIDVWQRSVLFWDVLRKRANIMLEHEEAGMPPVLSFQYEMLLDARLFERPANYALLRITTVGEVHADKCVDENNPPVIVIDPRAGHGPGIGGFKRESEVGIALRGGFPVYFVSFFPAPSPHQRLVDVLHALRRFVDEVMARHPGKMPVLYGNCQAGWAAMLVAIHCKGAVGTIVLNGSPLSYWAGEAGANPMRLAGGLLGGSWLTNFVVYVGYELYDGASVIQSCSVLNVD